MSGAGANESGANESGANESGANESGVNGADQGGAPEPLVLRAANPRWTLVYLVVAVALVALSVAGIVLTEGALQVDLFLAALAVYVLVKAWRRRGSTLTVDADGLRTTELGASRSYAWADLLEVGWVAWSSASGVLVRPTGGRYDVPGPNAPERIITLPTHGRAGHAHARQQLRTWCERAGVPFTEHGADMELTAPPGSPFREEPRRRRRRG